MKIRVYVQKSRIGGQGLFAGQDMKQGTRIIQYVGEKISGSVAKLLFRAFESL